MSMDVVSRVSAPVPAPVPESGEPEVDVDAVVAMLGGTIGSAEPAVAFLSVTQRCVPRICVSAVATITEAGTWSYMVATPDERSRQSRGSDGVGAGSDVAPGRLEDRVHTVTTTMRGPATEIHPAYEGALMMTFERANSMQSLLGQLVVERTNTLIGCERQREIAELHRNHAENLDIALQSSRGIGIALGIIMCRQGVTEAVAFDLLSTRSQNTHRKLKDLALDVAYTGTFDPGDVAPTGCNRGQW